MAHFPSFETIADRWRAYDNSFPRSVLIGCGVEDREHVLEPERWDDVERSAQTNVWDDRLAAMMAENEGLQLALDRATKTALLEHARMGRSVYERRDGKVVEVTPAEIFARYGLDEFGRPAM